MFIETDIFTTAAKHLVVAQTPIRGYYVSHEVWPNLYTGANRDVVFGLYYSDGSCVGEMTMVWEYINGELVPRLNVFCDAWHVLGTFKDVIDRLATMPRKITIDEFVQVLRECGFVNMKERKAKLE